MQARWQPCAVDVLFCFCQKTLEGNTKLASRWGFGNRREIAWLVLFAHRFYNPRLMRWQTADPIGFEDGLNLYHYVPDNPFRYQDPDGQFAIVFSCFTIYFWGAGQSQLS
ncbi:RHS repeat domain-containing protein [Candidatus Protochlamydia phocaeensis]|uniref:RHS repeat domain-containing protein n=1 Tax=Candidatus Protochlamydia phocaeensis TaxID=1414722 RepID=UPI0008391F5F|nr:RHS repeat-associated core domain-containing protein [Candidatus Protochlamydia phocaeensis]